jgi:hypothetical protein
MFRTSMLARFLVVLMLCLLVTGCKSKVNKENLDKITVGMSLEDVQKILGKGEKETGDGSNVAGQFGVAVGGAPAVGGGDVYVWENNKVTVRITFKQGKVVHKDHKGDL